MPPLMVGGWGKLHGGFAATDLLAVGILKKEAEKLFLDRSTLALSMPGM